MVKVYFLIGWLVVLAGITAGCSLDNSREIVILASATPWKIESLPIELPTVEAATGGTAPDKTTPVLNDPMILTDTPQPTGTPLPDATLTPIPTYVYLRGKVIVDQANCRYGPGWPYLYKYGVYRDSVLEIIGRNEVGSWVLIRGVGGTNACWVKASLLQIRGDVMTVAPTDTPLPASPYYGALTGVSAVRNGEMVTVSWNPLYLRAGDDSEQTPYVVEAWVCQEGELVFIPVGVYTTHTEIHDAWGCSEPSHARVTAAEKHGYTAYVEIAWPLALPPGQDWKMDLNSFDLGKVLASFYPRKQGNYREYAFLALGFPYGENALKRYIRLALSEGEELACRQGVYYRLADASGAEFWVHTRHIGHVSGVDVFFAGNTSTPFGLEEARMENDEDPLEGGFYGWSQAVPTGSEDPDDYFVGEFPTAFSVPDIARHLDLPLPVLRPVQYAAFAKGLHAFSDEADFGLRSKMNISPKSFFPSAELEGWVTFAGQILDCGMRRNGITGQEFAWAAVEAYGATLDVVANPRTLRGTLVPGGYAMGHFWLMGRLL